MANVAIVVLLVYTLNSSLELCYSVV